MALRTTMSVLLSSENSLRADMSFNVVNGESSTKEKLTETMTVNSIQNLLITFTLKRFQRRHFRG